LELGERRFGGSHGGVHHHLHPRQITERKIHYGMHIGGDIGYHELKAELLGRLGGMGRENCGTYFVAPEAVVGETWELSFQG